MLQKLKIHFAGLLAALLARGMVRASQVDIGFDGGRLLTMSPAFGRSTYDAAGAKAYWELALERVRSARDARAVLIRVPVYERDWTVPLKAEVGLPSYWDPDHQIEYDEQLLRDELSVAGLEIIELQLRWGEIWAAAEPR